MLVIYTLGNHHRTKGILSGSDVSIVEGKTEVQYLRGDTGTLHEGILEIDGQTFNFYGGGRYGAINPGSFYNKCRKSCLIKTGMKLEVYHEDGEILRVIEIKE